MARTSSVFNAELQQLQGMLLDSSFRTKRGTRTGARSSSKCPRVTPSAVLPRWIYEEQPNDAPSLAADSAAQLRLTSAERV
jgi:hypothetical protein